MSRILSRKKLQNTKMANEDTDNNIITHKKRFRNCQVRRKSVSKLCEMRSTTDLKDPLSVASFSKRTHSSPQFSIICSLPLYKISGILEKVERIGDKFPKKAPDSNIEDKIQIIEPCLKILCLYCDKKFSSHNIYKKHVEKLHTSLKTRRYSRRNSNPRSTELNNHTVHTPPRTLHYSGCCYCNNSDHRFAPQDDFMGLFFHMVDFHSEKYFGCKLCILRFQSHNKLMKHINSMHKSTSTLVDENWGSKYESHSGLPEISDRYQFSQSNLMQSLTSIQSQNLTLYKMDCSNIVKNLVFNGDEPILSRLGVTQNRLPIRKSSRNCRDGIMAEILPKVETLVSNSKIRGKVTKVILPSDPTETIFRVPTRNDTSCLFEEDFYKNVISNVRENIIYHLDGRIVINTEDMLNQNYCYKNSEIHKATKTLIPTPFPTLLTPEQYGMDVSWAKMGKKRSITKHSWKWKWDSFKKFKLINEGGKIVKKIKQPILNMRDLSTLDMWTQLTMRQKTKLHTFQKFSGEKNVFLSIEDKQMLSNQLSTILDTRILPQIILEQREETIVKLEYENTSDFVEVRDLTEFSTNESNEFNDFFSKLKLLPTSLKIPMKQQIILSGEWARPRCYLCISCGTKFEKLKTLEEHKMFRHSHVHSTHYEIVGRELMEENLLSNFFIPCRAFAKYTKSRNPPDNILQNKNIRRGQGEGESQLGYDSSNNMKQFLQNSLIADCRRISSGIIDTGMKMVTNLTISSPSSSTQSVNKCGIHTSESTSSSQLHLGKDDEMSVHCTKCSKKYNATCDLYRHMLDCSGDYIWSLTKKRKYRYYCGSKKRRQYNKTYRTVIKNKKKQSSLNDTTSSEAGQKTMLKTKTLPRQKPSDAESIKKMLENLPPKRVCKTTLPILNKTRKSRLVMKRKGFNSQILKRKLSKRIRNKSALLYKFKFKPSTLNTSEQNSRNQELNSNLTHAIEQVQHAQSTSNDGTAESKLDKSITTEHISITNRQTAHTAQEEITKNSNLNEVDELNGKLLTRLNMKVVNSMSRKITNIIFEDIPTPNEDAGKVLSKAESAQNEVPKKSQRYEISVLPSISAQTNSKRKRSKKIHDCIAMLTGKLEQKLQTENTPENVPENIQNVDRDRKQNSPSTNKTAKRKTYSRKILKPTLNQLSNKINSTPKSMIADDNRSKTMNLKHSDIISMRSPNNERSHENVSPSDTNNSPAKKVILTHPEKSTASSNEIFNLPSNVPTLIKPPVEISPALYAPALNPLSHYLTSRQDSQIITDSVVSNSIVEANSTFVKHNIPTRRQTICVNGTKFCDDVRPLDLSMKSKTNAIDSVDSPFKPTSPAVRNKRFTSCLNLIRVPQVKSPPLNNKSESQSPIMIHNSKKPRKSKSAATAAMCKKDYSRPGNIQKMDEVVIDHINDAINYVVNGGNSVENKEQFRDRSIEMKLPSILTSCRSDIRSDNKTFDTSLKNSPSKDFKEKALIHEDLNKTILENKQNGFIEGLNISLYTSPTKIVAAEEDLLEKEKQITETDFNVINKGFSEKEIDNNKGIDTTYLGQVEENGSRPSKKQRKRRRNELAAIVADQLLESFKIDKARRDNLRKLENLAYEKSEDLLAGMVFMSSTKRLQNTLKNSSVYLVNPSGSQGLYKNRMKNNTHDHFPKSTTTTDSSSRNRNDKNEYIQDWDSSAEWKKLKKRQFRKNEKCTENENMNNLKSSLESFTLNSLQPETSPNHKMIRASTDLSYPNSNSDIISKGSTILRPSILTKILEPLSISNSLAPDKTSTQSRDPRLNKNIHSKENGLEFPGLFPRHCLQSDVRNQEISMEILYDAEEDNYLNEIAKDVNEKVMSLENGDFKFVGDEFEIGSMCPENSISKYCRPSTSMSVCSAPNLDDNNFNFGSVEENTNTVDLDDNLSVYTSFSQDVNRGHKRKRRRRSILLSRKHKKKFNRDLPEQIFECSLCKKTFHAASSLSKHQTTLAHVSKVSEQEYFSNSQKRASITPCNEKLIDEAAINKQKAARNENSSLSRCYTVLNPDEKLFFECCNILKGSESLNTVNISNSRCRSTNEKHTRGLINQKQNHPLNSCCNKESEPEVICELGLNENEVFRGTITNELNSKRSKDIHRKTNIINTTHDPLHTSGINNNTSTVSRFKTKAAMKGYENVGNLNFKCDITGKSGSSCKLSALAEIALGTEKSNSKGSEISRTKNDLSQCNLVFRSNIDDSLEVISLADYNKDSKKSGQYDTTSSKTIMHCSAMKTTTNQKDQTQCQTKKIIIPERPFMNIGLEEKQTIKFEKPRSNVNLLEDEKKDVFSTSTSANNDQIFEIVKYNVEKRTNKNKVEKEYSINSNLSKATSKAFENKSVAVGRIFRNANQKSYPVKATPTSGLPKTDFSSILDELIESTPKSKNMHYLKNKRTLPPVLSGNTCKDAPTPTSTSSTLAPTKYSTISQNQQEKGSTIYLKEKQKTKLRSELGMSSEEIAQLIDERLKKPKRRCANKPKKLVEMWSSDEYEEFLSTNDIFALIEEKEKEEKRKKRKSSKDSINTPKKNLLESDKIASTGDQVIKESKQRKNREREGIEISNKFKLKKHKLTKSTPISSSSKSIKDLHTEAIKDVGNNSKRAINLYLELPKNSSAKKTIKSRVRDIPTTNRMSLNRRRRLTSEKLYYWSSSEDDEDDNEDLDDANSKVVKNCEAKEQYQKHGWIVGDSHKKLVTLLAITKGNKKVENCGVKKNISRKRN